MRLGVKTTWAGERRWNVVDIDWKEFSLGNAFLGVAQTTTLLKSYSIHREPPPRY